MANEVTVTGIVEVQRILTGFPRELVADCFEPALIAAGVVVQGELRRRAPRRKQEPKLREFPVLADSLVTDIEVDTERTKGVASTGFGEAGPVALWDEYGHRIVGHTYIDTGKHTPEGPFMRLATAACAEEAIDAFCGPVVAMVKRRNGD